jgi:hypothetical protein
MCSEIQKIINLFIEKCGEPYSNDSLVNTFHLFLKTLHILILMNIVKTITFYQDLLLVNSQILSGI